MATREDVYNSTDSGVTFVQLERDEEKLTSTVVRVAAGRTVAAAEQAANRAVSKTGSRVAQLFAFCTRFT